MMNKLSASLGLVTVAVGVGIALHPLPGSCQDKALPGKPGSSGLLWRSHYAGRAGLAQGTNATRLRLIDQLPASAALRTQVASNLARAPREFWQKHLPAGTPDAAELWRPLFDDLLQAESVLEIRGPFERIEAALAIQLNDDRARLWSTNLWRLAGTWKLGEPRPAQFDGAIGWECKRAQAPNLLQFARAGQWIVLGLGQDKLSLAPALLQQVARGGRPPAPVDATLLEVQADLPGLGARFPWLTRYGLPPVHFTARGRGDHVRTEVKFQFPGPVPWRPEPWQIPTNLVGEPLTSFTVARGVSSLLNAAPGLANLGLSPLPNQFCAWGVSNEQSRAYVAAPVQNAPSAVARLALSLPSYIQSNLGQMLGEVYFVSNRSYLAWGSIPFIQPYLQPVTNAGQQFIHAGIFPLPSRQAPAPPDLFSQLGTRNNLLYYDWEITPQRISSGRLQFDLMNILSKRFPQRSDSPSKAWLAAVLPELWKDAANPSQSVTEITQTAPHELLLVRKSHLGFTGIELAALSAWVDSPGFPLRYVPPPLVSGGRGTNAPPGAKSPAARPATLPPKP